ncbi:Transcription initiation factor IIA subunit 1-like protein [Drosera capensis]
MANSTTSAVYIHVVEDVINKVRDEFVGNDGPGEAVLAELQGGFGIFDWGFVGFDNFGGVWQLWEMKLIQAGAILSPIERPSAARTGPGGSAAVHDLNVPYEGPEEYETPTAEMLFPPTPLQTPIQTPLPVDGSIYNIPSGTSDYPTPSENGVANDLKVGRPSQFMVTKMLTLNQPPSPWMNQRPPLGVDVNVAYVEGREDPDRGAMQPATQDFFVGSSGKRKRDEFASQYRTDGYIPQQDGAGDAMPITFELELLQSKSVSKGNVANSGGLLYAQSKGSSSRIPQVDGPVSEPYDDILSTPNIYNYQANEDYNIVNTPAPNAPTPASLPDDLGEEDDDDEPLNEDDDDDLDEVGQGEEPNTPHLVLAQFDKVTRTKSRWKCTLKDGIMHINNRDILFNKATGEFEF